MAFVTHDLSLISSICSEVAVVYQGRFVETGPPAALLSSPLHPYTRALIASIPVPDPTAERPEPAMICAPRAAVGCAYAPRCPHAAAPCDLEPPRSPLPEPAAQQPACGWPRSKVHTDAAGRPAIGGPMNRDRELLLKRIDDDKDRLARAFQDFTRIDTANPPGDTRAGAAFIGDFLDRTGLPYRRIAPQETMPNLVAATRFDRPGPASRAERPHRRVPEPGTARAGRTTRCRGAIVDGRVHGRGTVDMKCGTTASIFTYAYLSELARRAERQADPHARLRRGDRRAVGQRIPGRASPGRGARRLRAQRGAEQPPHHPLRREGDRSG